MCLCGSRSSADPARSIASRRAREPPPAPALARGHLAAGRLLVRVPKQPIKLGHRDVMVVLCAIREVGNRPGVRPTLVKAAGPGGRQAGACFCVGSH